MSNDLERLRKALRDLRDAIWSERYTVVLPVVVAWLVILAVVVFS